MAFIDMNGRKINRWTVLNFDKLDHRGEAYWLCECDCGTVKSIAGYTLRTGTSKGCKKCRKIIRKGTKFRVEGVVARFSTRKGVEFIVSREDANKISEYGWCLGTHGYIVASIDNQTVCLHRLLLAADKYQYVDHLNGDKLNNTRENLRVASTYQNSQNINISCRNTSGFKGVHFNKHEKKWQGNIRAFNKQYFLGWFDNKELAALAYNEAAKELHGEYACLNPIGNTWGYRMINHRRRIN